MTDYQKISGEKVLQTREVRSEIDISYCKDQITRAKQELENLPAQKTKPDEETLRLWNETFANDYERQMIQDRISYFEKLLDDIEAAGQMPNKYKDKIKRR